MRLFAAMPLLVGACAFDPASITGGDGGSADSAVTDARTGDVVGGGDGGSPDPAGVAHTRVIPSSFVVQIDGNLDEWSDATFYRYDAADVHRDVYAPSYTPSVSVEFASMYSSESLYFAFRVTDDKLKFDSSSLYNDDAVDVYLDMDQSAEGPYGPADFWFVFRGNGGCARYPVEATDPVMTCSAKQTGATYTVEAQIALLSLAITSLPVQVGFGTAVNDDDDLDNVAPTPKSAIDAYATWFMSNRSECPTCCYAGTTPPDHTDPWCDTSRLGTLIF